MKIKEIGPGGRFLAPANDELCYKHAIRMFFQQWYKKLVRGDVYPARTNFDEATCTAVLCINIYFDNDLCQQRK